MGRRGPSNETLRLRAYRRGPTDAEAARHLGIPLDDYVAWRSARGLPRIDDPVPADRGMRPRDARERRILHGYRFAKMDKTAARIAGMSTKAFRNWRRAQGLPPKSRALLPHDHAYRERVYWSTTSDVEAARIVGISGPDFHVWRAKRGLPPHKPRALDPASDAERRGAYARARSTREAARFLGLSPNAFDEWRVRRGLPTKLPKPIPKEEDEVEGGSTRALRAIPKPPASPA